MKIVFSDHAQRRASIYKIDDDDVFRIINNSMKSGIIPDNIIKITDESIIPEYRYPLKVVFKYKERTKIIIITVYPLRKGRKNENLLR